MQTLSCYYWPGTSKVIRALENVSKYPCGICSRPVKQYDHAVCCDSCDYWVHNYCSGLSSHMYADLKAQPVRGFVRLVAYHRSHHHSGLIVMCLLVIRLMHYQQLMMRVSFVRLQLAHRLSYIQVIRLVIARLTNARSYLLM